MKKVQAFAAKEITVGDSQAAWQKWSQEGKQKIEEEEEEKAAGEARRGAKWTRQLDASTGSVYWLDEVSGRTTSVEPNFVEEEVESEEAIAQTVAAQAQEYEIPDATEMRAQVWEVMIHSLTRKPMWYCEEVQYVTNQAPPPHPWRGVWGEDKSFYFWNPTTGARLPPSL